MFHPSTAGSSFKLVLGGSLLLSRTSSSSSSSGSGNSVMGLILAPVLK